MISSLVSWEKLVKCLLLLFKSIDSTVTQSYLQALHMVVALPGLALSMGLKILRKTQPYL